MNIKTIAIDGTSLFSLEVRDAKIEVQYNGASLTDVRISFACGMREWIEIQDQRMFGYSPEVCGPIFGGGFNPTKDYLVTVGLKASQITALSILYDGEDINQWLVGEQAVRFLSNQENFLLFAVMQQVTPKTQWGLTTTYHPVDS